MITSYTSFLQILIQIYIINLIPLRSWSKVSQTLNPQISHECNCLFRHIPRTDTTYLLYPSLGTFWDMCPLIQDFQYWNHFQEHVTFLVFTMIGIGQILSCEYSLTASDMSWSWMLWFSFDGFVNHLPSKLILMTKLLALCLQLTVTSNCPNEPTVINGNISLDWIIA